MESVGRLRLLLAVLLALGLLPLAAQGAPAATRQAATARESHVLTNGIWRPLAVTSVGNVIWVANANNSVAVLDPACWCTSRLLRAKRFGFHRPDAIVADGLHVWVANEGNATISEFNQSDGSFVKVVGDATYGMSMPVAMASDGAHLWVVNEMSIRADGSTSGTDSVVEIDEADGAFLHRFAGKRYGFASPVDIAFDGSHLWVANEFNSVLTQMSAADGSLVKLVTVKHGSWFTQLESVSFDGEHLWVANAAGFIDHVSHSSAIELNPTTGATINVVEQSNHIFGVPVSTVTDGSSVWIGGVRYVDGIFVFPNSLTKVDINTGDVLAILKNPDLSLRQPAALALAGGYLWAANWNGNSVTAVRDS